MQNLKIPRNLPPEAARLVAAGKNAVIGKDGNVREAKPVKVCMISYTNCRTKQPETVTLQPGETFVCGDWDGTQCVNKTFTCQ